MRVFMLGWEFPPFISGGLGTACSGLTKAMSRQQMQIVFVLPKAIGAEHTSHVKLLAPQAPRAAFGDRTPHAVASTFQVEPGYEGDLQTETYERITFKAVPSRITNPYQSFRPEEERIREQESRTTRIGATDPTFTATPVGMMAAANPNAAPYEGDLIAEAQRYASLCVDLARGENFDVIHAHDWLTFPAGMAVAAVTGKPLVVHVHSTEFDRAGDNVHQQVYELERRGMHAATRVICVSYLTRSIVQHRYGIPASKIDVVYNGIENGHDPAINQPVPGMRIRKADKIVLFLGRITMQKGPEYFVRAAKKVLEKYEDVKFIMAGSGDKVPDVIDLAAREGIGHKVLFTGFLRGPDVERIFKMADVYVMPSVSEPFGIAPLEAISHDVPVIISKTSGVAEVLSHALKVDFWDTDEIANKIIAVLRHPPLSSTLREHADMEVRRLTWDDAALKCREVYERAMATMGAW